MTSYKLTDLNSDILNKIYEEITNRNKGEIREIAVFKEKYKKYMEENGFNPKHFYKWPGDGDGEYDFEITTTYQVCLNDPDYMDAEEVALMIQNWIEDYANSLSYNQKNDIIYWYGFNKALKIFYDWNLIVLDRDNDEICAFIRKQNIDVALIFQILKEAVKFYPSSVWRKD